VNPVLKERDHSQLKWSRPASRIVWDKSPLMTPFLRVAPQTDGNYLEAGLFFPEEQGNPAPPDLWAQFENRSDLVYYNWELTGHRVRQWRLICQVIRLLAPDLDRVKPAPEAAPPVMAVEDWLGGLESELGNTVTEVTRTAPDELTVTRSAPFVFTGLELVWLSHWLADVPAGPVNMNLIPKSTISGPGIPRH
jgi:hypothetical protein